jgi:mannobiose 2-epimerase
VENRILHLKNKAEKELQNILEYWAKNMLDERNGGFIGEINHLDSKNILADKGSVLNARILWTFSAAYDLTKNPEYLNLAKRAFFYIKNYFYDKEFGGIFWTLYHNGAPKDTKNQIYALAFTIYGLSEFYKIYKNEEALEMAQNLFLSLEYNFAP